MKLVNIYTWAVIIAMTISTSLAQIVNIPDPIFKQKLIRAGVDTNGDGEIQESEALAVSGRLYVAGLNPGETLESQIETLEGIQYFKNLTDLNCSNNKLTTLDISNLTKLEKLNCSNNKLTELNLIGLDSLWLVYCQLNNFTTLDFSNLHKLIYVSCSYNSSLESIYLNSNYLNLREKSINIGFKSLIFWAIPNIKYICVKGFDIDSLKQLATNKGYPDVVINSFCANTSEDAFYGMVGKTLIDIDDNGCDSSDASFPNLKIKIFNATDTGYLISGTDGGYSIDLNFGTYTFAPIFENYTHYDISPESVTLTLPDSVAPDFCITPKGNFNDLSTHIIPIRAARPGYSGAKYKVKYINQGTTTQSGTLTFSYNEDSLNFISSIPAVDQSEPGLLTFNFNNLAPLESREITITMRANAPTDNPAVNNGDVLVFTSSIEGVTDDTPEDNTFSLYQTVVGSFDPNDKTCLQGDIITPDLVGKKIDYLIRFENTGTADAENIVITDYIDTSVMDVSSLLVTDASHTCHTQISQGNKVQFIFSDIQLPFTEPDKHGYVAFSIKLKDHLQVGDSIKNQADIYFDYNLPITTNVSKSEINYHVVTSMYTQKISSAEMSVYPNPSSGNFSVEFKSKESKAVQISVLDATGKTVYTEQYPAQHPNVLPIDIHHLAKGTYLIRAQMEEDVISKQVVVQ